MAEREWAEGDEMPGRCAACNASWTVVIGGPMEPCPTCGQPLEFLRAHDDVTVTVNWHELRILGIWAERWAATHAEKNPDMQRAIARICGRLHAQHPERSGLTFSAEIADLRRAPGVDRVEVHGFDEDDEANASEGQER